MHEAQLHDRNCFLTLTYDDAHVPLSLACADHEPGKKCGCALDQLQLFWKRWREKLRGQGAKLRYYAAGEYTEFNPETDSPGGRPHWHACVFGANFDDRYPWKKSPSGEQLYRSPDLERLWPYGFSSVGSLSFESAAYVARYCMKKLTGDGERHYYNIVDPDTGEIFPRRKEFSMMSKGIGQDWLRLYWQDVRNGKVVVNGKECNAPRYYMRKMRKLGVMEDIQQKRHEEAVLRFEHSSPERLAAKAAVTKARVSQLKRGKV